MRISRLVFTLFFWFWSFSIPSLVTAQQGMMPGPGTHAAAAAFGCPSGSGSCFDTFTGTPGTQLATYNSSWTYFNGVAISSWLLITPPGVYVNSTSGYSILYYSSSTSDTSQITTVGIAAGSSAAVGPCTRCDQGVYAISWIAPGTNATVYFFNGLSNAGSTGCHVNTGVPNTLKLVTSGTGTVTNTAYVNGTLCTSTYTDSSGYSSGHPGAAFESLSSTVSENAITAWQDH